MPHDISSEVVDQRNSDGAKKQHARLITILCHRLVSDLYLFERVTDTRKYTNTHTERDTHAE